MMIDLILGTAGHIDHGKTALVKALTGVDTDRLPEEKRRGITIDLGFAELVLGRYRLGIVDVPGHERFVRNMLAGATGIDLALLVVAADDSVKPQTREHFEILRLLGLASGVIALTKCDLPDPEWINLVEEEVRELVAGSFLQGAPLVRTSAATGLGLEELRGALAEAAGRAAASQRRRRESGPFRLAVDRAFTLAGHGTVVTGSVASGKARAGDELVVEPGGVRVRIRSLENHGRPVEEVHRGQRAAINLAGVHHGQFDRGDELASPGHLVPSRRISVRLDLLASAPRPLKSRARVRLHVGGAELVASIDLLDRNELRPGDGCFAQLVLGRPAVTTWSQPLVIRSESPVTTIGGGVVLDPDAPRLRRNDQTALEWLADLSSTEVIRRASAAAYFFGHRRWTPDELSRAAGVDDVAATYRRLVDRGDVVEKQVSPTRMIRMHQAVFDELSRRIAAALEKMHEKFPLLAAIDRSRLASQFAYLEDEALVDAVLESMASDGRIELQERSVALAGHGPQLSRKERQLLERVVEIYHQSGLQPPTVEQLVAQAEHNRAAVPDLVELAAAQGSLIRVSPDFYLHADVERQLRRTLREHLSDSEGLTVSEIREILSTTRKYAVPLCEYLDSIGFTQRRGDRRMLGQP